jgi:hypothetical protein
VISSFELSNGQVREARLDNGYLCLLRFSER